jgi:hypothetical protein
MPRRRVREVLKRHADDLMAVPGVVGIGVGESQGMPCILVFVVEKNAEVLRQIPNTLEGYLIQVEESGDFRARVGPI